MTEVKTIGEYINALPDEIREEVRRLNTIHKQLPLDPSDLKEGVICCLFTWEDARYNYWKEQNDKYTLTEKEGKYYTNW